MQVDLIKSYRFEAAHATPWRDDPACLHGHSFEVELLVSGDCDPHLAWLMDYAEISTLFEPLFQQLDHQSLNEIDGLAAPTLEGLRLWIDAELRPQLPLLKDVRVAICGDQLFAPKLLHTDTSANLPERLRFTFEAAHALPNLPPDHKCHTMHGHSFSAEVGAAEVEALTPQLQELYEQLDHTCLNKIAGLENPTSEAIAGWIWTKLSTNGANLKAVVVAETCTARCIYYGR